MSLPISESSYSTETRDQALEVVYDRNSIISWLSTVESEPASPGSLYSNLQEGIDSMASLKRQRSELDSNGEQRQRQESPSKRRKTASEELSRTEVTESDEPTTFVLPHS